MNHKRDWFWIAVICAAFFAVFFSLRHLRDQLRGSSVTESLPPGMHVLTVPTKTVTADMGPLLVKDPADQALIKKLMAENAKYKLRPDSLAFSTGTTTSNGTLVMTLPRTPDVESVPAIGIEPAVRILDEAKPQAFEAEDYRLHVKSDGKRLAYTLTQKFVVLNTSGRAKDGTRVQNVKLYEVGPNDARAEIPVETNEVSVDETVPHWLLGFNVQAGVVASPGHATGYIVGLQWLKRGRADNPKDLKLALLTPVGYFAPNDHQVGLLPLSVNVANLVPHQPLTNLWVSPYVGFAPGSTLQAGTINRVGVAVTATF